MKDTWLIQRLRKPHEDARLNPFNFGIGGGRMNPETRQALKTAFEFDYMGSAEFEFGSVPEALEKIYNDRGKFITGQVEIPIQKIKLEGWEKQHYRLRKDAQATVFIWCLPEQMEYAKKLVLDLAMGERSNRLKERSMLRYQYLEEKDGYRDSLGGWLEMDNGFFFFTDEKMFRNTLAVFGVEEKVTK
jgi:hypothetical protein